jgi:hypothetical protein
MNPDWIQIQGGRKLRKKYALFVEMFDFIPVPVTES